MQELPQILVNGLIIGGVYALVAVGYSLVYGVLRLINFAHGGFFTVGAFASFVLLGRGNVNLFLVLFLVAGLGAGLGVLIERVAYRPLRCAPTIAPLITALGVYAIIENGIALLFGSDAQVLPPGFFPNGSIGSNLGFTLTYVQAATALLVLTALLFLWFLVYRTQIGRDMRAVADNRELAAAVGINNTTTIRAAFAIGSALGASAGIAIAADVGCDPYMGMIVGFKAFAACVVGGIGSIGGAVIGGLLLGIFENLVAGYISTEYKSASVMALLVLLLLARPDGLFAAFRGRQV